MRARYLVLIGSLFMASLSGALARSPQETAAAAPAAAASSGLPDGPGRDRLVAVCSGCHEPTMVVGQHRDLAGWKDIIDQMIAKGAVVSDEDYTTISTYLANNSASSQPPKKPAS